MCNDSKKRLQDLKRVVTEAEKGTQRAIRLGIQGFTRVLSDTKHDKTKLLWNVMKCLNKRAEIICTTSNSNRRKVGHNLK